MDDIINRLTENADDFCSCPLCIKTINTMQDAAKEIQDLREQKNNFAVEYSKWKAATYYLAHMLSKLDGDGPADKYAVEAYEASCECDFELNIYCEKHW